MSDLGHPGSALRGFRGLAHADTVLERRGQPREWEVRLREVRYLDGDWDLHVEARWTGTLPGAPPLPPGVRPGSATDIVAVGRDLELAHVIMGRAEDALRAGNDPDLRALLRAAKERIR